MAKFNIWTGIYIHFTTCGNAYAKPGMAKYPGSHFTQWGYTQKRYPPMKKIPLYENALRIMKVRPEYKHPASYSFENRAVPFPF